MTKNRYPSDPLADQEAERYERPVPSRQYILDRLRDAKKPMFFDEIIEMLGLTEEVDIEAIHRRVKAMRRDGQVIINRKKQIALPEKMDLVRGKVRYLRDGTISINTEGGDHVRLHSRDQAGLFDGDNVVIYLTGASRFGYPEARLVEIFKRGVTEIVGRYTEQAGAGFVVPENPGVATDILIVPESKVKAEDGQIVSVRLLDELSRKSPLQGEIVEVLGEALAPGLEIDIAIRAFSLPYKWTPEVLAEVEKIPEKITEADLEGRNDLRHLALVTIDGEDAKDFDDAVFCERLENGDWRLIVAIADVSHYVKQNSSLDASAYERGTSVYFPGQVLPMLPEQLSNNLCSLKPEVDRLCMACEMIFAEDGTRKSYEFSTAVMFSHARLTYGQVSSILQGEVTGSLNRFKHLFEHLYALNELYELLHQQRVQRGALDFESRETRIVFGPHKKIERIVPVARTVAHTLIEECMLAANIAAAEFAIENELPVLFRVHEGPTEEKLENLRSLLKLLGLKLSRKKIPEPSDFQHLLKKIKDRPDGRMLQMSVLRSLQQAQYSPNNVGHFGLAYECYTHFTSPIRRYPDLQLHRAICGFLTGTWKAPHGAKARKELREAMQLLGEHCSSTERRADDATRDVVQWLKCEYMSNHLGEVFTGVVSGVTNFGLFIELDDVYVEGLLHITGLEDDYYHFDNITNELAGERTGKKYHIGDCLRVRISRVDLEERKIDFDLVVEIK